jgi:hypothetical protein
MPIRNRLKATRATQNLFILVVTWLILFNGYFLSQWEIKGTQQDSILSLLDNNYYSQDGQPVPDPQPTFQTTRRDLYKAIDLCIDVYLKEKVNAPCSIIHLTTHGVYLDFETSERDFETQSLFGYVRWKKTVRSMYITSFLRKLHVKRNSTMVFYHRDSIPEQMKGYPIITHTTQSHQDFILFPTPYMLRDLLNGELMNTIEYCTNPKLKMKVKPLQNRIHDVYFRGRHRNDFRLQVAYHHRKGTERLPFNVRFTDPPKDSNLTKVGVSPWTKKMEHEYLLTIRGGYSSQWDVYHDYVAGGVIVRETTDKKEFWNYDLISNYSHYFVNFDTVESIADEILNPDVQKRKQEMANATSQAACSLLKPKKIYAFGQSFIEQYTQVFESIDISKTYTLPSGRKWTPKLVKLPSS